MYCGGKKRQGREGGGGGEGLEDGGGEWSIEGMQGVGRGVIILRTERKSVLELG